MRGQTHSILTLTGSHKQEPSSLLCILPVTVLHALRTVGGFGVCLILFLLGE